MQKGESTHERTRPIIGSIPSKRFSGDCIAYRCAGMQRISPVEFAHRVYFMTWPRGVVTLKAPGSGYPSLN